MLTGEAHTRADACVPGGFDDEISVVEAREQAFVYKCDVGRYRKAYAVVRRLFCAKTGEPASAFKALVIAKATSEGGTPLCNHASWLNAARWLAQDSDVDLSSAYEDLTYLGSPCPRCGAPTVYATAAAPGIGTSISCSNGHNLYNDIRELRPEEVI